MVCDVQGSKSGILTDPTICTKSEEGRFLNTGGFGYKDGI